MTDKTPNNINRYNTLKLGGKRLGRENWLFYSMYDEPLFINNEHMVNWYLQKDLIEVVGDKEVRFKFEVKGKRTFHEDKFLLSPIERRCVVCAREDGLQKHHVVPHMYRKFMPQEYKSSNHHDVLIICYEHHYQYEVNHSDKMKDKLALDHGVKTIQDLCKERTEMIKPHNLTLQSCRTLLKHNLKLPVDKISELSNLIIEGTPILKDYDCDILTEEEIQIAHDYHFNIINYNTEFDYVGYNHAKIIVDYYVERNELYDLVVLWRKDFVDNMKPQFLPQGWDIYRKDRLFKEEEKVP